MFVDFFIRRPIFATVCALLIILAGAVSIPTLPIAQFPDLAPPQVTVLSGYNGASAEVVESAVTIPLEQEINGVEGMKYLTSSSGNDGTSSITATFDISRNVDQAAIDVQNRVSAALGRLPTEVKNTGVIVNKAASGIVFGAGLYSDNQAYSSLFISNYIDRYLKDALKRVKGVGNVVIFGERKYAMRLWLDPEKMASHHLTAPDVAAALREQNVQVAAGQIGQPPAPNGQSFQISVRAIGRLTDAREFENIVLKTGLDGSIVQMKNIGRAELGAESYNSTLRFNGHDAVGMGIFQLPGSNAIEVNQAARAEITRLSKTFPPGLKYDIAFDTTTVVNDSIKDVVSTLGIAILLVVLVMFLFLQSWRSTLIPALAIPVSLVGTFAFVKLLGFSINTLTLFGITLATGLVVDDAIVVIENIERHLEEQKTEPHAAASTAMKEVAGAVIATSLVLVAVFLPVSLFPGTTGILYRQFALTIAFSVSISAFNALTLTPALSALLLRQQEKRHGRFFGAVNHVIDRGTRGYIAMLSKAAGLKTVAVLLFGGALAVTFWLYGRVPKGFVPNEDVGYFITLVQAPAGASLDYTRNIVVQVEREMQKSPDIHGIFSIAGFSFAGNAPNRALIFSTLIPLAERKGDEHSMQAVINRVRGGLMSISGALVIPFPPPPIQGVGSFGGFEYVLQDQGGNSLEDLDRITQGVVAKGNARPDLRGLFSSYSARDPQIVVSIDRDRAKNLGVPLSQITDALQVYMGSEYVNDFDFNNRSYRVYIQADQNFRSRVQDISQYYVRSGSGAMMPLENLVTVRPGTTPQVISHYNLFRSASINGSPAPGRSSGDAIAAMQELSKTALPRGISYDWTGLSLEEIESGGKSLLLFALGALVVYLTLSAQYESFVLPFIILLAVPTALLGALGAQSLRGLENDIYCQIGLVMLIGLSSKNAILIVEFAEQLRGRGLTIREAAIESARIRLRPILMTSLAFILGVLPLVLATGAGQASRHSVGTTVFGGMIASTFINLFLIPILYIVIRSLTARDAGAKPLPA